MHDAAAAGIDARAHNIALLGIQQLVGIILMVGIILAEHHIFQAAALIHNGKRIELMLPDNVVGFRKGGALGCGDELFYGSHEILHLFIGGHPRTL